MKLPLRYIVLLFALPVSHVNAMRIDGTFHSDLLDMDISYAVLTPSYYDFPGYENKHYPVVYGLHGANSDKEAYGQLPKFQSEIQDSPAILATFSRGGISGDVRAFFFQEFAPYIEGKYRAGGSQGMRAVSGFSSGAGLAHNLMLTDPDFFSSVTMIAGGTNQSDIATHLDAGGMLPPMYFLCGENDLESLRNGVSNISAFLTNRGVYHEAYIIPLVGHEWAAINDTIPMILEWQYQYFHESSADWRGEYPFINDHFADTDEFMGTLYVKYDPWLYSYDLSSWVYLPEGSIESGSWAHVMKN